MITCADPVVRNTPRSLTSAAAAAAGPVQPAEASMWCHVQIKSLITRGVQHSWLPENKQ
jgi:hypothetical protein